MRLTATENGEAIKRYRHIKPVTGRGASCAILCPGTSHNCTRPRGHGGPHVAHGRFRRLLAVWDSGTTGLASAAARVAPRQGSTPAKGRPIGLRSKPEGGVLQKIGRGLVSLLTSWDQLVFVILFVVFVKFAIDVLMSLY